jgi:signal peptidase I
MAAELCHQAAKLLNHQKDLLSPEAVAEFREAITDLRTIMHSGYDRAKLEQGITNLEQAGSHKLIPYRNPGLRENVEVLLFAVAIAMSIRTFFFQPMGIPTGSMQPTLYGITEGNLDQAEPMPTGINSWVERLLAGVSHYHLVSEGNWQLIRIEPPRKMFLFFNKQRLVFRDLDTNNEVAMDINPPMNSGESMLGQGRALNGVLSDHILNPNRNYTYKPGEDVIKMRRESGDHLLVNRVTFNLRRPKRGEIIVFETKTIDGIKQDLFYIKRLTGMPGDTLAIGDDRHLIVKNDTWPEGERLDASHHPFEYVYSFDVGDQARLARDSQFSGHANQKAFNEYLHQKRERIAILKGVHPSQIGLRYQSIISPLYMDESAEFQVPPNRYVAMGDNTVSSKDSRDWGSLPAQNIFGKASFIYWPFLGQNSRIRPNRFGWAFQ